MRVRTVPSGVVAWSRRSNFFMWSPRRLTPGSVAGVRRASAPPGEQLGSLAVRDRGTALRAEVVAGALPRLVVLARERGMVTWSVAPGGSERLCLLLFH